jgi:aryl-alcohol dehydrogenase-like predicted oxidoreductase
VNYRVLGRTGVQVSEVGLGGHREGVEARGGIAATARFFLPAQERARVVGRAIDAGVTYFDTTYGCEAASLGESLQLLKRREGLFVSGMRVDFFKNWLAEKTDVRVYTRREVEACLRDFDRGPLDQFLLGAMDMGDPLSHPRSILDDAIDELHRLRDEGKIRFIGFSCHEPDYAARLLESFPAFDTVMTPYNFVNRQAEGQLADVLRRTGAGWVGMKPLVWHVYGLPVTVLRSLPDVPGRFCIDRSAAIAQLALRFVLANPLLSTCVPAVNTVAAVDENVAASGAGPLSEAQQCALAQYAGAMAAEEFVPLAIAGLLDDDLRVRSNAIAFIRRKFNWAVEGLDYEAEDAPQLSRCIAEEFLGRLRKDPQWTAYCEVPHTQGGAGRNNNATCLP